MGRKIVVGLAALVLAGSAFAYSQIAPNYEITPTPYNPPATTIAPTPITPAPSKTPSLEEKLADRLAPRGQLSDTQISNYTLDAYNLAYEAVKTDNDEMYKLARGSLGRVIDSVVNSIFEGKELGHDAPGYDELLALRRTTGEYLYGGFLKRN